MAEDRQEWSDFLWRACHDLRSAMRAVRTSSELLLKSPEKREGAELEKLLGFLVEGARKADGLVDGLAAYAGALKPPREGVPMGTAVLLKNAIAKLAGEIRTSGAEIAYDDLPRITCDPERITQVFEHLLRNSIQHRGDAAARIHVNAREQDGEWIFAVRDNGPGIEADDLERIFRPFERVSRDRGGAGLGLAICRAIVEGQGGRIWAESKPGDTAFCFTTGM